MMSDRPRLELNTVQLSASVLAAVTGAVLTSYLGVGGTIIGTAVGSLATTSGFAIYQHYLGRTKERINHVAPVIVEHARTWTPPVGYLPAGHAAHPTRPGHVGGHLGGQRGRAVGPEANGTARPSANGSSPAGAVRPEDQQTQPMHALAPTRLDLRPAGQEAGPPTQPAGQGAGPPTHPAGQDAGPPTQPAGEGAGPLTQPAASQPGWARRRWLTLALTSAAVFLVAIAAITVFEFATGKPLAATVHGQKGTGTTLGGGQTGTTNGPSTRQPTQTTSPTPGATQPSTGQPSTGQPGTGQATPQPSSGASTSPAPSSVPSPSSLPSLKATPPPPSPPAGGARPTG
jgi:hypothetical protein